MCIEGRRSWGSEGRDAFREQPRVAGDESDLEEEEEDRNGIEGGQAVMKLGCEELSEDRRPDTVRGDGDGVEEDKAGHAQAETTSLADQQAEGKER